MADDFRGTEIFGRQPRAANPPATQAANRAATRAKPTQGSSRRPGQNRTPASDSDDARRPGTLLGVVALIAALATIVLVTIGVTTSMRGDYAVGTVLAFLATGVSIVAVLGGIAAILLDRGRGWGAVAIVLGLAANPLLLTRLLAWVSGLG